MIFVYRELGEPCDATLLTRIFHAAHFRSTPIEDEGLFTSGPIVYVMVGCFFKFKRKCGLGISEPKF